MTPNSDRDRAFSSFFAAHAEDVRRLGVFLTSDPEQGRDLAQEALVRTYRAWDRIEGDPFPYCKRALVNQVRSAHRRRLVAIKHAPATATSDVEGSRTGSVDDWVVVRDALAELSPVRRAAVVMRFYEDMSEADIARVLDRPLNTVKSDIHRGLKKLRPLLEEAVRT